MRRNRRIKSEKEKLYVCIMNAADSSAAFIILVVSIVILFLIKIILLAQYFYLASSIGTSKVCREF